MQRGYPRHYPCKGGCGRKGSQRPRKARWRGRTNVSSSLQVEKGQAIQRDHFYNTSLGGKLSTAPLCLVRDALASKEISWGHPRRNVMVMKDGRATTYIPRRIREDGNSWLINERNGG
jgi:hypothetical protein